MSATEKNRLQTKAGVTATNGAKMSGADLAQAALLAATGQSVGGYKDGARLMQLHGGPA